MKNYFISTDKTLLDTDLIHDFLSNQSYWSKGISRERVEKAMQNALCYGVYEGKNQIGYARVITDYATFGYVADVFILENHRGKGLSKALIQAITEHPELKNMRRLLLATADAHGLYAQYGFNLLEKPERWMEIRNVVADSAIPHMEKIEPQMTQIKQINADFFLF